MLSIELTVNSGLLDIDDAIWKAVVAKVEQLTATMHEKVIANVSGAILQKQSGQLAASIQQRVTVGERIVTGDVFPDPATDKAWALERGGTKEYTIVPVKANVLHWLSKDGERVFAKRVNHPPSQAFRYLESALDAMRENAPEQLAAAVQAAIDAVGAR